MSTTQALADLIEARAKTDTAILTYRGMIPTRPTRNYTVLLFSAGITYPEALAATSDTLLWRFRAMAVGWSEADCLWVADRLRQLFTNWRPLSSRAASWVTEEQDDAPVLRDESVINDVRYSLTLRFRITTPRST
jgi:hypothetical protein